MHSKGLKDQPEILTRSRDVADPAGVLLVSNNSLTYRTTTKYDTHEDICSTPGLGSGLVAQYLGIYDQVSVCLQYSCGSS